MYISVYILCILFCSLTFVHADPEADVEYGKPSEGSHADIGLLRNIDIDKEHLQKIERFVEFRKRLKQREKERHSPDIDDNYETKPLGENGGRTPANGIDKEHLQKLQRFVEFRKRLKQRKKQRHAPESDYIHEEKPVAANSGRTPANVKPIGEKDTDIGKANRHRRRRWDYDENYDWENGGKDYVIPGEEKRKTTKLEEFAKSWQKHALKVLFLFSVVCMVCCCCLAICKKLCTKVCETLCWHCKDYRDICLRRDPTWRKARQFADDYGVELDYEQYKEIKSNYEQGFQEQGHDQFKDMSGR